MALVNGKQASSNFAVFLVDGYNVLAAKVKQVSWKKSIPLEKTDGLGDSWDEFSPTGVQAATIKQTGAFFDTATNSIHDTFKAAALTVRLLCFAPAGNDIGSIFIGAQGAYTQTYDVASDSQKLTKASAEYAIAGSLDEGVIVQSHTSKTVDWNTKTDGTVVDYAADPTQTVVAIASATKASPCVVTTSRPHNLTTGHIILTSGNTLSGPSIDSEQTVTVLSTTTFSIAVNTSASTGAGTGGSFVRCNSLNGGAGQQAISYFSGLTGFVGKIRHSTDNSTYSDLITFTNVTSGPAAERLSVSGTVHRYLCFDGDVTGTGSIKPFVGFKRNA